MKKHRRLLMLTIAILAIVIAGTSTVCAESGKCGDSIEWNLSNGVLKLTGTGKMYNYSLTDQPFTHYKIKAIEVSEGITSIGSSTFFLCDFERVTLPETLTLIGGNAFNSCIGLEKIEIPDNVSAIGPMAFSGCSNLKYVKLPKSVETWGFDSFRHCENLETLIIPEGVQSIGRAAFMDCIKLKEIDIPNSVQNIEYEAFGWRLVEKLDDSIDGRTVSSAVLPDVIIKGYSGSEAHSYAAEDGLTFISIGVENPIKTSIIKTKKGKASFTVKWKKQEIKSNPLRKKTKDFYQVQYSMKKIFAKKKAVKVDSDKNSLIVKKLQPRKTYFVRVRLCRTIGDETFFSNWSNTKTVRTK